MPVSHLNSLPLLAKNLYNLFPYRSNGNILQVYETLFWNAMRLERNRKKHGRSSSPISSESWIKQSKKKGEA
jgi:hypothetical protein